MIKYNDMVDSRRLQHCTVDNHSSLAHASARDKLIREKGRFGYVDTPVPDADWLYRCTVRFVPVGLCVPRDAPQAVVDINSADVVMLGSLPEKVGLFGRRKYAAASRILQGRDSRSIRFLVPDVRGVDQNFHDVTIVDMDEEREPKVTAGDLTHLRDSWPPGIFNHMKWFQQDLELMRKEAKREFTQA